MREECPKGTNLGKRLWRHSSILTEKGRLHSLATLEHLQFQYLSEPKKDKICSSPPKHTNIETYRGGLDDILSSKNRQNIGRKNKSHTNFYTKKKKEKFDGHIIHKLVRNDLRNAFQSDLFKQRGNKTKQFWKTRTKRAGKMQVFLYNKK